MKCRCNLYGKVKFSMFVPKMECDMSACTGYNLICFGRLYRGIPCADILDEVQDHWQ